MQRLLIHIAVWTALGLVSASQTLLTYAATGGTVMVRPVLVISLALWYSWAVVSPVAYGAARRFPLRGSGWPWRLLPHLALCLALTALTTALYMWLRALMDVPARGRFVVVLTSNLNTALLIYGGLVAIEHMAAYYKSARERERASAELKRELAEARLQSLQSQIHPHFLFNTLHAIASTVRKDPQGAEDMLGGLGDMLRSTLGAPQASTIPLREELHSLERYLQIQAIRFQDRLIVERSIDDSTLQVHVPPFLLQPLVENAIEHGIADRRAGGTLRFEASQRNGDLVLRVDDDGDSTSDEMLHESRWNVGLRNTRDRLHHLYGERASVRLQRHENGVRAEITIPMDNTSV